MDLDKKIENVEWLIDCVDKIKDEIALIKIDLETLKEDFEYKKNINHDFPVGVKVKVICKCQDFNFFNGETGVIERSQKEYFGLRVKFDKPRKFDDGTIQESFNFEPGDLKKI